MRKLLLIAGVAALAAPGVALAQTGCFQQQHDNRVAGTTASAATAIATGPCNGLVKIGYYDDQGVYHAGLGYYDANGDWHSGASVGAPPPPPAAPTPPSAGDYGADVAYTGPADDLQVREAWIEHRIHADDSSGILSRGDTEHDFDVLAGIRQFEARRAGGNAGLSPADRADVMNKLDNLTAIVNSQRR